MKAVSIIIRIVLAISIAIVSKGNEFTKLKPIKPTTILQPYGKVVNQYKNVNIRVHIDVISLFEEVEKLCYAAKILKVWTKTMIASG